MKAAFLLFVTAGVATIVAGHAMAADCNGNVTTITNPVDGNNLFYIDDRDAAGEGGIWVYAESNGDNTYESGGNSALLGDGIPDPTGAIGEDGYLANSQDSCSSGPDHDQDYI